MKIPSWITKRVQIPPSARWDTLLIPVFYVFNCFTFSGWSELGQVITKPWLIVIWLYGLAVLIPLVWRDRAPTTVLVSQWVLTVAAWPIMPHYVPVVGVPVALYAVAVHLRLKTSLIAVLTSFIVIELAATVAFRVGYSSTEAVGAFVGNSVFLVTVTAAAWGAGRLIRANRRRVQQLEDERQRLEREQETAREAVAAERKRIARELHDIVSHAVTVIVLQAAGAAQVVDSDSAQVTESLGHIEASGMQAMAELRRLLGVLDITDPPTRAVGAGELGPQPGLADVTKLMDSLRTVGLSVTVHTEGAAHELDPSVDLAAYRIIQEGLTNVLKHAGKDSNPRLRLAWDSHSLHIQINNDTNADHPDPRMLSGGRGLMGLHERAYAVGGSLQAGFHGNGYRLTATLPVTDIPHRLTAQRPLTTSTITDTARLP